MGKVAKGVRLEETQSKDEQPRLSVKLIGLYWLQRIGKNSIRNIHEVLNELFPP